MTQQKTMAHKPYMVVRIASACLWIGLATPGISATADAEDRPTSLPYVWGKAFHIPPETTTEESGYFSLCEGRNGKIYIGTAAYGRNAYVVEFDPITEKMRIVLDTHKVVGLPLTRTGYAAQAKIHTRNFVGPSGKIYVGSKQGYPTADEGEALKRGEKIPIYRGGYVMNYNPATGTAKNLGMPMPLGDPRLPADATSVGASTDAEGEGVIDVVADEARGLVYVITCEHEYWMLYDLNHPEKGYRLLGPILSGQPNTLVDREGRATAITKNDRIARYDPRTDQVTVDDLLVDGKPIREFLGPNVNSPDWRLAGDGRTAYVQFLNDLRLFHVDLSGAAGQPVIATDLGNRIEGVNPDSRGSISIGPDGRVYSVIRIDNGTGFGDGYLHHLVRYDPTTGAMDDLGVLAVKNPGYAGDARPNHGFHTLPDGTLTPLHTSLAMIVARDGTVYVTVLSPFTLLKIDAGAYRR